MKKILSILMLFVLSLSLVACSPAARSENDYAMPASAPMMPEFAEAPKDTAPSVGDSVPQGTVERIVIKNATLSIVVKDPAIAITAISDLAEKYSGFVVTSNTYKRKLNSGAEVTAGNIVIRVDARQLDQALEEIKALTDNPATDVENETVKGEDVTSQYTDLQSRLRNLENSARKLDEILEDAKKTEDVLAVYQELISINEQIEVIKGQIQYYDEASRLSSIAVDLTSQEEAAPLSVGGWQPSGVARNAIQALINTFQTIGSLLIWLVLYVLPVLILLAIPVVILILVIRKLSKKARLRAPKAAKPEVKDLKADAAHPTEKKE